MEQQIAELRLEKSVVDERRDFAIREIFAETNELNKITYTSFMWNAVLAPQFPPDSDFRLQLHHRNAMLEAHFRNTVRQREVWIGLLSEQFFASEAIAVEIRRLEQILAARNRERDREMYEAHPNAVNYNPGWYPDFLSSDEDAPYTYEF